MAGRRIASGSRRASSSSSKAGRSAPVERFVPELRSDVKWKFAPGTPATINPQSEITICWTYGVPFEEMQKFHAILSVIEIQIQNTLNALRGGPNSNNVSYLGTYLNIDGGAPMYRTCWGFASEKDAEIGLDLVLTDRGLRNLVEEIRVRWGMDPGRTEHRFGMAARYVQFDTMRNDATGQAQELVKIPPQK